MTTPIRVLYVDDETDLLNIGKLFLERSGNFEVTTAISAPEAIRLLEQEKFDAIISDYQMPDMDGIQFLVETRKRFGAIPFILFTGRGREEIVIQAINSGADFYLQKGGDPKAQFAELSHKVRQAASRKIALDALRESEEKYQVIVDHAHEAIMIIDSSANVLFVNPAAATLIDIGNSSACIGKNALEIIAPESREAALSDFVLTMEGKDGYLARYKIITATSRELWVELIGKKISFGSVPAVIVMFRDITGSKVAEEALAESEQRLNLALEGTGAGLWDWDMVNDRVKYSAQWKRMLGYKEDEVENSFSGWKNLWHPDDITNIEKTLNDYLTGKTDRYENIHRLRHKDGSWRWIVTRGGIIKDATGKPVRWVGTNIDITERKQAEKILQDVIDKNPMSIQIVDKEGYVLKVNSAHTRLFGAVPPSNYTIFDDFQLKQQGYTELLERAKNGEVVIFPEIFYNAHNVDPKFSDVPVWIRMVIFPINDSYGKPERYVTMQDDISGRKVAEEALAASEEQYRLILKNAHDMIYVTEITENGPGKILVVNDKICTILGYTREEMLAMTISDLDVPEQNERIPAILKDLFTNHHVTFETEHITKSGNRVPVEISATLFDLRGKHTLLAIDKDITERKLAENTLQRVNQKLNIITHLTRQDLSSQIFVLSSYLELAKKQLSGQDRIIETLQKGFQTIRLIHETIEYSKDYQDMGAKPAKWQNVKMTMLLGLSHTSIGKIQRSFETETLEIFADPLFEKVCQRLFENSLAHGKHVTRIRVWHTATPDSVTIVLEDDGIGIPAEKKEQIFLRSEGNHDSMRSLIFVREILDITGITISETGEPGKGARFEMVVPKGAWRMSGKSD